ncbi:MAG TPA: hypothetical protein VJ372_02050 [Pyrinomonadaceae bacterium]|jgi:hypothetical protein|nr:hypothetical protein [Pyrinomonadaceae bacterium]
MKKIAGRTVKLVTLAIIFTILFTALRIYLYGNNCVDTKADAAVVLGAAVGVTACRRCSAKESITLLSYIVAGRCES